jgi:hypothetical protein
MADFSFLRSKRTPHRTDAQRAVSLSNLNTNFSTPSRPINATRPQTVGSPLSTPQIDPILLDTRQWVDTSSSSSLASYSRPSHAIAQLRSMCAEMAGQAQLSMEQTETLTKNFCQVFYKNESCRPY